VHGINSVGSVTFEHEVSAALVECLDNSSAEFELWFSRAVCTKEADVVDGTIGERTNGKFRS
jgi:hypothetical protein